jgi:hypothetical protein
MSRVDVPGDGRRDVHQARLRPIFDVHGGTIAGAQVRDNTKLHELL